MRTERGPFHIQIKVLFFDEFRQGLMRRNKNINFGIQCDFFLLKEFVLWFRFDIPVWFPEDSDEAIYYSPRYL